MSVNLLLSYFFHDHTDLAQIRKDMVCGRLLIDSGAFSAMTTGREVDRLAYAEYLERWAGCWDYAVTLDVIGDPAATAGNTRWLHQRGIPVMPVHTLGNTVADFDAMVREHGYVCIGGLGLLPLPARIRRCVMLQRRAAAAGGGVHLLGVGAVDSIRASRPYSADSSRLSSTYIYGSMSIWTDNTIRQVNIAKRNELVKYRDAIGRHGIDLADLVRNRRLPGKEMRLKLTAALGIAWTTADEYVKEMWPSPTPNGMPEDPGPHLYMAVTPTADAIALARLDADLHGPGPYPPLWAVRRHSHRHSPARKVA